MYRPREKIQIAENYLEISYAIWTSHIPSLYLPSYCTAFVSLFSKQAKNGINSQVNLVPLAVFGSQAYEENFKLIHKIWSYYLWVSINCFPCPLFVDNHR